MRLPFGNGVYKLGDSSCVRIMERMHQGPRIGVLNYIAPEIYKEQPYSCTSDIYSLGMVLYWMLNERRLPFLPMPSKVPTMLERDLPCPTPTSSTSLLNTSLSTATTIFLKSTRCCSSSTNVYWECKTDL